MIDTCPGSPVTTHCCPKMSKNTSMNLREPFKMGHPITRDPYRKGQTGYLGPGKKGKWRIWQKWWPETGKTFSTNGLSQNITDARSMFSRLLGCVRGTTSTARWRYFHEKLTSSSHDNFVSQSEDIDFWRRRWKRGVAGDDVIFTQNQQRHRGGRTREHLLALVPTCMSRGHTCLLACSYH